MQKQMAKEPKEGDRQLIQNLYRILFYDRNNILKVICAKSNYLLYFLDPNIFKKVNLYEIKRFSLSLCLNFIEK